MILGRVSSQRWRIFVVSYNPTRKKGKCAKPPSTKKRLKREQNKTVYHPKSKEVSRDPHHHLPLGLTFQPNTISVTSLHPPVGYLPQPQVWKVNPLVFCSLPLQVKFNFNCLIATLAKASKRIILELCTGVLCGWCSIFKDERKELRNLMSSASRVKLKLFFSPNQLLLSHFNFTKCLLIIN